MQLTYPNGQPYPRSKGYFGIGIENIRSTKNLGTLWRSAHIMGADFIFVIGGLYQRMKTDTMASYRHTPLFYFENVESFVKSLPMESKLVGVELAEHSEPIAESRHPKQAVYLLGSEFYGLSEEAMAHCHHIVQLPGEFSLNVSVVGSLVMYDRLMRTW